MTKSDIDAKVRIKELKTAIKKLKENRNILLKELETMKTSNYGKQTIA